MLRRAGNASIRRRPVNSASGLAGRDADASAITVSNMLVTRLRKFWILAIAWSLSALSSPAAAQACTTTTVMAPSPLMGNHGEIFRTADGAIYEVVGSYEYLYAYYPTVIICAGLGKMQVEDRTIGVRARQAAQRRAPSPSQSQPEKRKSLPRGEDHASIRVVLRVSGCDYFIADGPRGLYLLEWYGGYDPSRGDGILGEIRGYGFKDILYAQGQEGRVYVDDYLLGKDSALEKIREKCH